MDTRMIQIICLSAMAFVLITFGASIYAQQYRKGVRPTWPLPGGLVGGTFLVACGSLPMMMSLVRIGWLGWTALSWQQTVVYLLITTCSIATIIRWWRFGFEDTPGAWNGLERRSGKDRRKATQ